MHGRAQQALHAPCMQHGMAPSSAHVMGWWVMDGGARMERLHVPCNCMAPAGPSSSSDHWLVKASDLANYVFHWGGHARHMQCIPMPTHQNQRPAPMQMAGLHPCQDHAPGLHHAHGRPYDSIVAFILKTFLHVARAIELSAIRLGCLGFKVQIMALPYGRVMHKHRFHDDLIAARPCPSGPSHSRCMDDEPLGFG
jgi:hypothetical protein